MPHRGHTCTYCQQIDEAHFQRHKEIAEGLRDVYDSADQRDWPIIPSEIQERGRSRSRDAGSKIDANHHVPTSKRQRKDAKRLARAASRSRIITLDEINYVEKVIHAADDLTTDEAQRPSHPREIEEIERHLKENANVYSSQKNAREIKRFAEFPDADINFKSEVERIFDVFRITELTRRNTKTKGLYGQKLKAFEGLTCNLEKIIVDDLVRVRMDELEIGMRRDGFLRYIDKQGAFKLADRYTGMDWKTGEKHAVVRSGEGTMSPVDRGTPQEGDDEAAPEASSGDQEPEADLRHLEMTHKYVNSDGMLSQQVIEPYDTPLLPKSTVAQKPHLSLRVIDSKNSRIQEQEKGNWETVGSSSKKGKAPCVRPAWGVSVLGKPTTAPLRAVNPWDELSPDSDLLSQSSQEDLEMREAPPAAAKCAASKGPQPQENITPTIPPKSSKKAQKQKRETRRKAKKVLAAVASQPHHGKVQSNEPVPLIETNAKLVDGQVKEDAPQPVKVKGTPKCAPHSPPVEVTRHVQHADWLEFTRYLSIDHLNSPSPDLWAKCAHGKSVKASNVDACPCHPPREYTDSLPSPFFSINNPRLFMPYPRPGPMLPRVPKLQHADPWALLPRACETPFDSVSDEGETSGSGDDSGDGYLRLGIVPEFQIRGT